MCVVCVLVFVFVCPSAFVCRLFADCFDCFLPCTLLLFVCLLFHCELMSSTEVRERGGGGGRVVVIAVAAEQRQGAG